MPLVDERTAQVVFHGDLDLHNRDAVSAALPEPDSFDRVAIDCSAVTSIDSSVVTVFMRYRRKFVAAGLDPFNIIFIASRPVRRIFEITGLLKYVTVIDPPEAPAPEETRAPT
jgi:anti-anti-sigma factor